MYLCSLPGPDISLPTPEPSERLIKTPRTKLPTQRSVDSSQETSGPGSYHAYITSTLRIKTHILQRTRQDTDGASPTSRFLLFYLNLGRYCYCWSTATTTKKKKQSEVVHHQVISSYGISHVPSSKSLSSTHRAGKKEDIARTLL